VQLARLLDDLLDVNRIRSGKVVLRKERVDVADAASHAVESVRPQIDAKQQKLVVHPSRDPVHVRGDPARLAQVIANLLGNASKYTGPEGHIALTVVRTDDNVVLSVRDSGIGISADQMSRIFEMFAQAGPAGERAESGLGVGLALARTLVELHGGHLEARSQGPGRGSEFIVRLPADTSSAPPPKATETPRPPARQAPRRILVADDNVDSAEMLATALRELGHEVVVVHDGVATVEVAKNFSTELAFLDIGMPRMNGYEAAAKLRERFGDRIKLVAVTGWGQEADRRRAAEATFDHHLTKPVDLRVVEQLIGSATTGTGSAPH